QQHARDDVGGHEDRHPGESRPADPADEREQPLVDRQHTEENEQDHDRQDEPHRPRPSAARVRRRGRGRRRLWSGGAHVAPVMTALTIPAQPRVVGSPYLVDGIAGAFRDRDGTARSEVEGPSWSVLSFPSWVMPGGVRRTTT